MILMMRKDELLACIMMGSLKIHEQIRNGGGKRSMEREEMNGGAGTSRRKQTFEGKSFLLQLGYQ